MTLRMLDSISPGDLPAGADAYAGYVNGAWPTFSKLARRFPGAHLLSIAVTADADAECLDVEAGDATVTQAAGWVKRQHARGVPRPVVYASANAMPAVIDALLRAGIPRAQVRLWSAHYSGSPHICGPASCASKDATGRTVPACDGTQWRNDAPGRSRGSQVDESALAASFFTVPQPVTGSQEDFMIMLNLAAGGPAAALAVPPGKTTLVLAADPTFHGGKTARLRVAWKEPWGVEDHDLSWDNSPLNVALPHGVTAVTLAQTGTGWALVTADFR